MLEIPTAYAAKELCSGIFVAGLDEQRVFNEDVDIATLEVDLSVDYTRKTVSAKMKITGGKPFTAIYRDGIGCTVVDGMTEAELRAQNIGNQAPCLR